MTEESPLRIISERELTPDELLWLDIRAEAIKATPTRVADSLARLITLTTALAGGAIGVLKDDVCTPWGRVLAAVFFFAALLTAVVGSLPRTASLPVFPVGDIRSEVQKAIGFKERCAIVATALMAVGIAAAILGVTAAAW